MECLDEKVAEYNREKLSNVTIGNQLDGITVDIFNTVFNLRKRRLEMVRYISSIIKILSNSNTIIIKLLQIFLINSGFYKSQNPIKFHKTVNNTMAKV